MGTVPLLVNYLNLLYGCKLKRSYIFFPYYLICLVHDAASISVVFQNKSIFKQEFSIARRSLRIASEVIFFDTHFYNLFNKNISIAGRRVEKNE